MLYNTAREETAIQSQQYKILGRNFVQHKHCYTLHQRIRRWLLLQVVVHLLVVWCWPYSTSNTDSKYSMVARAPSLNELTNSSQPAEAREKHTGEAKKAQTPRRTCLSDEIHHIFSIIHTPHCDLTWTLASSLTCMLYTESSPVVNCHDNTCQIVTLQHLSDWN